MHDTDRPVSRIISPNDQMVGGATVDQYLAGGKLALDYCVAALGGVTPRRILDFPSGHGRVLRWFHQRWPDADTYAVEVDRDALAFCEKTFGAKPIESKADIESLDLPEDVDLIWSGSLLTHFNEAMCRAFIDRCIRCLRPDGVLVFTTHGRLAVMLADRRDPMYGPHVNLEKLCDTYRKTGFAYEDYDPQYPVYGLTFSSPSWIAKVIEGQRMVRLISYTEGGWGHQDACAVRKLATPI